MPKLTVKVAMTALPLPLILILVLASAPAGERARVSGTSNLTYVQQHTLDVGDFEGHMLMAAKAQGSNRSTGQTDFMGGAEVINVETLDLTRGNGTHNGYITFSKNGGSVVGKWGGKVTTTLSPENTPMTTFRGTWTWVKGTGQYQGITGGGTYQGRFTSQTEYTVDWEGNYAHTSK